MVKRYSSTNNRKEDTAMTKKAYMKPTMQTVALKQRAAVLVGSPDVYGMNKNLIEDEEVLFGW